jgi:hypothetical protein
VTTFCINQMHQGPLWQGACLYCALDRIAALEARVKELETFVGCNACLGMCSETITRHNCAKDPQP